MATVLGGLAGLLGGAGSTVEQLFVWNVMGQVLSTLLTPYLAQAGYDVLSSHQIIQISVAEAAEQVLKTIIQPGEGEAIAAKYGISKSDFDNMVKNVGEPPGIIQVLEWYRRGQVPWDGGEIGKAGVVQAVKTSRIRNEWTDVLKIAQFVAPSAADAINAWVRNQVPESEARSILTIAGIPSPGDVAGGSTGGSVDFVGLAGSVDFQRMLYNTAGRPPAPTELASLVHRGVIPVHGTGPTALTFEQGILEGDLKDKWEAPLEAFITTLPGVFEIRQMQLAGGISPELAAKYYAMQGLPADLIPGAVAAGSGVKAAKHKDLTEAQLLKLYVDGILTAEVVTPELEALGYDATEIAEILHMEDIQKEISNLNNAVTRARSLYLSHKVSAQQVATLLNGWGIGGQLAQDLVTLWGQEQAASPRLLTEAQIVDAVEYGVMTAEEALGYLEALGYSPYDAWVLLSIKLKAPQGTAPAEGRTVAGRAV